MTNYDTLIPNRILLTPVIEIPYIMAIFYPKTSGVFFFGGFNVSNTYYF